MEFQRDDDDIYHGSSICASSAQHHASISFFSFIYFKLCFCIGTIGGRGGGGQSIEILSLRTANKEKGKLMPTIWHDKNMCNT